MLKKRYNIPKSEITRDYHQYKPVFSANDLILECDFEDLEEEYYVSRNRDKFAKEQ